MVSIFDNYVFFFRNNSRFCFKQLLFPAEYNASLNASANAEVERMLRQPEEKCSVVKKKVFIKGR